MAQQKSIGVICTSTGFGGLEMITLKSVKWLGENGWNVRLLLNEESPAFKEAKNYCEDISTVQQFRKSKPSAGLIKKWLAEKKVSVLFTPFNKDIKSISGYKRFFNRKIKLVYQQHMKVGVNKRDLIHRLRYNMLDLWISPLPYLKEEVIQRTHVPSEKIKIIPVGVDTTPLLNSDLTQQKARQQLNLQTEVKILGVLGRIDPKKGQDFAIRAIAHLRDHHNKYYHLLIMGNITHNEGDAYLISLYELVRKHQLEQLVHFRPYHTDVNLFYKAIDVFLMPSHGETYGLVTLESMLAERPVIGVNRDGTRALLQEGKLGWLHDLEDIEGFCKQLSELETSAGKENIIQDAKQEVLNSYSFEAMMHKTDLVLTKLLHL